MSQKRRTLFTNDAKFALKPAEGKPGTLTGYALVWNVLSSDRGGYAVRLMPGSARFATPTHALLHHDFSAVIGSTANNSLRIAPDDYGVKVEIDLPNTTTGKDAAELVGNGYITGMSFAMVDQPDGRTVKEKGIDIFEATAFLVDEVTVTAIPSFEAAQIGVKADLPAAYAATAAAALRFNELRFSMLRLP